MATDDLFTVAAASEKERRSNVPEMSVSELAQSLKRTLEDTFGRVRVRGELSGLKLASSGHLYGDVKDADANINIVCWKGTISRLSVRPADGLDVIITGKMTSFPKNSRYQLVIDTMELAGEGALLKMLEDRRKALAAEGLFDPARKRPLPFLPETIGVVTSPTGAVIRDILHRIEERFPRHVLIWPVAVQGEGAAAQIAAAIRGFNALTDGGSLPRPDLLIVARGGGSLEDLMAFNDEAVIRAAADSHIPLISAVGHETDTTLIDYAADLRAPTPTGAAERAVPVRSQLMALVRDDAQRLDAAVYRMHTEQLSKSEALFARLGDPTQFLNTKAQLLDIYAAKLSHGFERLLSSRGQKLAGLSPSSPKTVLAEKNLLLSQAYTSLEQAFDKRLSLQDKRLAGLIPRAPSNVLDIQKAQTDRLSKHLAKAVETFLSAKDKDMNHQGRILESLSFKRVLDRGFAVVRAPDGTVLSTAERAKTHKTVSIQFSDDAVGAKIG